MARHWIGVVVLLPVLLPAVACEPCGVGERSARGEDGQQMCLNNDEPDPGAVMDDELPPSDTYPMPPSLPPPSQPTTTAPPPDPPPPPKCETLPVSSVPDVPIVVKAGSAPAPATEIAPPDGKYVLVQASAYPTDPSGSPVEKIRASLDVKGSKVILGAQATKGGTLETNESFTFTFATSAIVKFCQIGTPGSIASYWFPGGEGVKRQATLAWDAATNYFTLVVRTPFGDVELVFTKS